jgi:proline iminopeptidase
MSSRLDSDHSIYMSCPCRRFFDPSVFRIVLLDQRGCGSSMPTACLIDNNSDALVQDIEKLRAHLGIDAWLVLGGSWGVALALAYSMQHPTR